MIKTYRQDRTGHGAETGLEPAGREAPRGSPPRAVTVPNIGREIRANIGRGRAELEGAFRLLASNYRARGYEPPGPKPFRFTPYHALPGTATFVARHDGRVVATLSLVPDTELLGLPMESIYGAEIEGLRRQGRRLAEVTSLAAHGLTLREFTQVFGTLIKLAMQYHLRQGGDTWVMTVHPRHRGFYRKVLGMAPLGARRPYPAVLGHPAEACVLDVDLMRGNAPGMYREALGELLPESVLEADGWSAGRVRYFGRRSATADPGMIEAILGVVERHGGPARWAGGPPDEGGARDTRRARPTDHHRREGTGPNPLGRRSGPGCAPERREVVAVRRPGGAAAARALGSGGTPRAWDAGLHVPGPGGPLRQPSRQDGRAAARRPSGEAEKEPASGRRPSTTCGVTASYGLATGVLQVKSCGPLRLSGSEKVFRYPSRLGEAPQGGPTGGGPGPDGLATAAAPAPTGAGARCPHPSPGLGFLQPSPRARDTDLRPPPDAGAHGGR